MVRTPAGLVNDHPQDDSQEGYQRRSRAAIPRHRTSPTRACRQLERTLSRPRNRHLAFLWARPKRGYAESGNTHPRRHPKRQAQWTSAPVQHQADKRKKWASRSNRPCAINQDDGFSTQASPTGRVSTAERALFGEVKKRQQAPTSQGTTTTTSLLARHPQCCCSDVPRL